MRYQWILWFALLTMVGCAGVQSQWTDAETRNTVPGYLDFLRRYPDSEFAGEARTRIQRLRFNEANQKDEILYYTNFLKDFPKSEHTHAIQANLNHKVLKVKAIPTHRVMVESAGATKVDGILLATARELMPRLGCEVVTAPDAEVDAELRLGRAEFNVFGVTALGGTPVAFLASVADVALTHRRAGAVFEERIVSPKGSVVKMTYRDGRLVKASPSDPKEEQRQIEASDAQLPIVLQTEVAEHFERYLGKGMAFLLDALKSADPLLQAKAAVSLGRLRDARAVEPLIAVLAAQDKDVRSAAARSLGDVTGQKFGEEPAKWRDWWQRHKPAVTK